MFICADFREDIGSLVPPDYRRSLAVSKCSDTEYYSVEELEQERDKSSIKNMSTGPQKLNFYYYLIIIGFLIKY